MRDLKSCFSEPRVWVRDPPFVPILYYSSEISLKLYKLELRGDPVIIIYSKTWGCGNDGGIAPDCKSGTMKRSWFESNRPHQNINI